MDSCIAVSYVIVALSLIVVAQSAALLVLARAWRAARRRAGERARQRAEARSIAHDLNNLLAVILNYASFVLGDLAPDDRRREDVAEIRRAAEQAGVLSHALLGVTRGEEPAPPHQSQDAPARPTPTPREPRRSHSSPA